MASKKNKSTKKRSSTKKQSSNVIKGLGLGAGLTALTALAYKQGLFDKLAEQVKGNSVNSPTITMEPVPVQQVKQTPISTKKIQEEYMLNSISKVLRKPVTEIKAKGITTFELTELRKNNIEVKDIEPFVKIIK
jgi:hypothetical protein